MPSSLGADTIVDLSSPAGSNRPFEFFEFQVAPMPEESNISLPTLGNNTSKEIEKADLQTRVEVLQSKGNDGIITRKPLWGRPWFSLRNILKPSKKADVALQAAPLFREWKHPVRLFSLKDIKLATEDFSAKFIFGEGSFGTVYKGFINDGLGIVAIKRFWSTRLQANEEFQAEVELLSTIRNVHLVPFVGLCIESNDLIVVYEYMSHGTLKDHLYRNNRSRCSQTCLTWEQRLKICTGAARGLKYLHELGDIYRDLNINNIMLDENFVAKISDYGLSKLLSLEDLYSRTGVVGSLGYLDPVYIVSGKLTKASDVYSFGIVLLVVLSGRPAFDYDRPVKHQLVNSWYETCSRRGNFDELIDPKLVGGIPSASLGKFVQLIKSCLHKNPEHRPVMAQVVVNLEVSLNLLGKKEREAQSAVAQQALQLPDTSSKTAEQAEQVKRMAGIARLRELHTLKGHVESVMKLKGLDIETMHQNYTV